MKSITHRIIEAGEYQIIFVEVINKYALKKNGKIVSFYDSIREAVSELKTKFALAEIGETEVKFGVRDNKGIEENPIPRDCKGGLASQLHPCKLSRTIKKEGGLKNG